MAIATVPKMILIHIDSMKSVPFVFLVVYMILSVPHCNVIGAFLLKIYIFVWKQFSLHLTSAK